MKSLYNKENKQTTDEFIFVFFLFFTHEGVFWRLHEQRLRTSWAQICENQNFTCSSNLRRMFGKTIKKGRDDNVPRFPWGRRRPPRVHVETRRHSDWISSRLLVFIVAFICISDLHTLHPGVSGFIDTVLIEVQSNLQLTHTSCLFVAAAHLKNITCQFELREASVSAAGTFSDLSSRVCSVLHLMDKKEKKPKQCSCYSFIKTETLQHIS